MKNDSCVRAYLYRHPFVVTCILAIGTFWCSFTINGIYNVAVENIMRRYELSATYMSSITAGYGIFQCLFVIPVSYRFGRKWKAKVIGVGMIIFSIGCFIFTLPHILSEEYVPNNSRECGEVCEAKLHKLRYLLNAAYLLLGVGNIPMYTLTLAYIHENNFRGKIATNHHYAWYHMNTAFGPAVGMLVGGQAAKVWVDWFDKNLPAPDHVTIDSKLWVGTWWFCYWISGIVCFSLGIFVLLFVPEKLKTRDRTKDDVIVKVSKNPSVTFQNAELRTSRSETYGQNLSLEKSGSKGRPSRSYSHSTAISGISYQDVFDNPPDLGEGHDWSDFFVSMKRLFSNYTFLGVVLGCTFDMGFVSVISMYGLIYLSEIYNIPQDTASLIFSASLATVMFALPGSGFATRKVDVTLKKDIKWAMHLLRILAACSMVCVLCLFMSCDDIEYKYAGGNVNFNQVAHEAWNPLLDHDGFDGFNPQLYGTCSMDRDRPCKCSPEEYSPVCANVTLTESNQTSWERVTFFSPCHLGCQYDRFASESSDFPTGITDCKCLADSATFERGACTSYSCDWRIYFIIPGLVLGCFLTFFQVVPGTLVTQAIVPDHLRSAALGVNALVYRILGTIPSPIIAAKIIDTQCLWWSSTCQKERGACRAFDKYGLSSSFVTILFLLKVLNVISYSFALHHIDKLSHLKDKGATANTLSRK